jgi:hypothetical protein
MSLQFPDHQPARCIKGSSALRREQAIDADLLARLDEWYLAPWPMF